MKLTTTFATTALISHATAVDLFLFKGRDCLGEGIVFQRVPENYCCHTDQTYLSSASNYEPGNGAKVNSYVDHGYSLDCSGPYTVDSSLGTCIAHQVLITRAISWHNVSNKKKQQKQSARRSEDTNACCEGSLVGGDRVFSDGEHVYMISRARIEEDGLLLPQSEAERADFFRMHADGVFDAHGLESVQANVQGA